MRGIAILLLVLSDAARTRSAEIRGSSGIEASEVKAVRRYAREPERAIRAARRQARVDARNVRETAGRPRLQMATQETSPHKTSFVATHSRVVSHLKSGQPLAPLLVCGSLFILVVFLSISALLTHDDSAAARKRREQRHAPPGTYLQPGVLVERLVVPSKNEFVFALKEIMTGERQHEAFEVVDRNNTPFCLIRISEQGLPHPSLFHGKYGLLLESVEDPQPLAFVETEVLHREGSTRLPIYRKDGNIFGYVVKERNKGVQRHYSIQAAHTNDTLLSLHGEFGEKAINVHNSYGQLVATTEKHSFEFSLDSYLKVKVAPCVDAGLVMLAILGATKLEG